MDEILHGLEWNETQPDSTLHSAVVTLMGFGPDRSPKPIGTAFIVATSGNSAIALTAAHNFWLGVGQAQNPRRTRHSTALPEFLAQYEEVSVDRKRLRAIYRRDGRLEPCTIGHAFWDKTTDLAMFTLFAQDLKDHSVFAPYLSLVKQYPKIGDLVGVLGYANMEILSEYRDGKGFETAKMSLRLVQRAGRVTAMYPEGHILCRGPCFETSIPVFGGMSGGPVFLMNQTDPNIVPIGLISTDPDEPIELKNDRTRAGASIKALLPHQIVGDTGVQRTAIFEFSQGQMAQNPESIP